VGGTPCREMVAVANEGQIPNLPRDVVVETWAQVTAGRIRPVHAGGVPDPLLGLMQLIIDEQELAVESALTGDRHKAVQAMTVSPMVHNKDVAEVLTDELLAANKDLLGQFRQ